MATRGPTADTLAGDIVTISVNPDGPYGVIFTPDSDGCAAVVKSFEKLPNGKFGPIQRDGGVHLGDVLFEINDVEIVNQKHDEVLKMISNRNVLRKVFKFINSRDYYRRKRGMSFRANPADQRDTFLSTVKRTRLSGVGNMQFVEYEISCQLRIVGDKIQKEIVYQWSVWKRYSQFSANHKLLLAELGWQVENIEFPSPRTFSFNKLSPEFIEKRREELKEYWQKITSLDKVTDFMKHHCSPALKDFLEVETNTNRNIVAAADMMETENKESSGEEKQVAPIGNRRQSLRAMSRRSVNISKTNSQRLDTSSTSNTQESSIKKEDTPPPSNASNSTTRTTSPPPPPPPPTQQLPKQETTTPPPPPTAVPPPPPPRQTAAAPPPPPQNIKPPTATAEPTANIPPKPQGARANLLSSINALRKD